MRASLVGRHTMPITPFLEGRVFGPETTRAMGEAFEKARAMLGLADKTDSATALLAMEIIALAEMGIHNADQLTAAVVNKFNRSSL